MKNSLQNIKIDTINIEFTTLLSMLSILCPGKDSAKKFIIAHEENIIASDNKDLYKKLYKLVDSHCKIKARKKLITIDPNYAHLPPDMQQSLKIKQSYVIMMQAYYMSKQIPSHSYKNELALVEEYENKIHKHCKAICIQNTNSLKEKNKLYFVRLYLLFKAFFNIPNEFAIRIRQTFGVYNNIIKKLQFVMSILFRIIIREITIYSIGNDLLETVGAYLAAHSAYNHTLYAKMAPEDVKFLIETDAIILSSLGNEYSIKVDQEPREFIMQQKKMLSNIVEPFYSGITAKLGKIKNYFDIVSIIGVVNIAFKIITYASSFFAIAPCFTLSNSISMLVFGAVSMFTVKMCMSPKSSMRFPVDKLHYVRRCVLNFSLLQAIYEASKYLERIYDNYQTRAILKSRLKLYREKDKILLTCHMPKALSHITQLIDDEYQCMLNEILNCEHIHEDRAKFHAMIDHMDSVTLAFINVVTKEPASTFDEKTKCILFLRDKHKNERAIYIKTVKSFCNKESDQKFPGTQIDAVRPHNSLIDTVEQAGIRTYDERSGLSKISMVCQELKPILRG